MAFEATLHRRNDKAHQGSAGRRRSSCTLAKTDIERMARWSEIWLRGRDLNPRPAGYEPVGGLKGVVWWNRGLCGVLVVCADYPFSLHESAITPHFAR